MALFIDEAAAEQATLVDDVRLPRDVMRQIRLVAAQRALAERVRENVKDVTRAAVNQLTRRAGLSVRDAAEMLGISYQRVQQLAGGGSAHLAASRPRRPRHASVERHDGRAEGIGEPQVGPVVGREAGERGRLEGLGRTDGVEADVQSPEVLERRPLRTPRS